MVRYFNFIIIYIFGLSEGIYIIAKIIVKKITREIKRIFLSLIIEKMKRKKV